MQGKRSCRPLRQTAERSYLSGLIGRDEGRMSAQRFPPTTTASSLECGEQLDTIDGGGLDATLAVFTMRPAADAPLGRALSRGPRSVDGLTA